MKRKVITIIAIVLFAAFIILPLVLHYDTYAVINNDTAAHLRAFDLMAREGYSGLYGAQVITGYILNHFEEWFGWNVETTFAIFNFGTLILAGFAVGFMVYRLTGNAIATLLTIPIVTIGTTATLHLFMCGTVFNIISILILLPMFIILTHYVIKKKRYWYASAIILMIPAMYYYHPSMGGGLFYNGEMYEAILPVYVSLMYYYGIYNIMILSISAYIIIKQKSYKSMNMMYVGGLLLVVVACAVIGYGGFNPYPNRVIVNMCLLLTLATVILMGMSLNVVNGKVKKHRTLLDRCYRWSLLLVK